MAFQALIGESGLVREGRKELGLRGVCPGRKSEPSGSSRSDEHRKRPTLEHAPAPRFTPRSSER
jgi:hypothetical protein